MAQLGPTLRNPMACSTSGFPVLHHLKNLGGTFIPDLNVLEIWIPPPYPPIKCVVGVLGWLCHSVESMSEMWFLYL